MLNLILYTIEISFLCFILWYIYRFIRIPHCVKELYGQANYTFLTSIIYSPFKNSSCVGTRPSALNPTFVFLYNNFIILKNNRSQWIINKDNFIEFNKPAFFKNCSIKVKEDNIYKSETIEFTFLSRKKISLIENFLIDNNFINN